MTKQNPFFTNPFITNSATRTLPNQGGSYNSPSVSEGVDSKPDPLFNAPQSSRISENPAVSPTPAPVPTPTKSKYINPQTGEYYTPQEYANSVASKLPVGPDVSQYAGEAVTNPDQSASNLRNKARNLNNARNDIATGTTDPYKIGAESGIAYSPEQLDAIEKAYAGIYDPALNDVFEKLKTKEEENKAEQARKERQDDQIFATNEAIRRWKATTGLKNSKNTDNEESPFTKTQLNKGASAAGINNLSDFQDLDYALKNFFINPQRVTDNVTKETMTQQEFLEGLLKEVADGTKTAEEIINLIQTSKTLAPEVKVYYISKMPIPGQEKEKISEGILAKAFRFVAETNPFVPFNLFAGAINKTIKGE